MKRTANLYRTIWRWHFYAGMFVMPMVLLLALTGAAYLFKPQLDRWEERDYRGLNPVGAVAPSRQLTAAQAAVPGASFYAYRLPEHPGDAAMVHLGLPDGKMTDVFVSPQGQVLGQLDPDRRLSATIRLVHGSLLLGRLGDWLVELAASWAIVMILSGLYLWWPRGRGLAGVVWPRLNAGGRAAWRDLHAVTGFWVSGLALVLLASGLPWAGVWGSALAAVRTELGLVSGPPRWETGAATVHASHDHATMAAMTHVHGHNFAALDKLVPAAQAERLAFPVLVLPPGAPQAFGPPTGPVWTVKSDTQNRPLQRSITYDPTSGEEIGREGFADQHPIDRIVGYGIAWHEGQLLGWFNQLIGVATALMLATLSVSGFVMWRRRKPAAVLGAPSVATDEPRLGGVAAIVLGLAVLLPLLALSLVAMLALERLVLARIPAVSRWLGLRPAAGVATPG